MEIKSFDSLSEKQQSLLLAAEDAMKNAFNPNSEFHVGGAVRTQNGKIFRGANMNVSSVGLIACAEVAAFLTANTEGEKVYEAIAIIGKDGEKAVTEPNVPCGKCCQIIHEFNQINGTDMEMIYSNTNKDKVIVGKVSDFFPHPFVSSLFRNKMPV